MKWKILLTPTAERMFESVSDRRVRDKICQRIDQLAVNPDQQGKPLIGELRGIRSLRAVGQRYRILFRLKRRTVEVLILAIGIRKAGDKKDIYSLARKLLRLRPSNPEE